MRVRIKISLQLCFYLVSKKKYRFEMFICQSKKFNFIEVKCKLTLVIKNLYLIAMFSKWLSLCRTTRESLFSMFSTTFRDVPRCTLLSYQTLIVRLFEAVIWYLWRSFFEQLSVHGLLQFKGTHCVFYFGLCSWFSTSSILWQLWNSWRLFKIVKVSNIW